MSTATVDRPTTGERYATACESSNLRIDADRRGDADLLVAAGWVHDFLGANLFRLAREFDGVRTRIRRGGALNQTELLLVLAELKSLRETKDALGRFAEWLATKERFMAPPAAVAAITGRVLTAFLNPTCPHCEGRGFNGGGRHEQSGAQVLCRACRSTGQQRHAIGKSAEEIAFASQLLAEMSEQMSNAEAGIRRNREAVDGAKAMIDEQLRTT